MSEFFKSKGKFGAVLTLVFTAVTMLVATAAHTLTSMYPFQ